MVELLDITEKSPSADEEIIFFKTQKTNVSAKVHAIASLPVCEVSQYF